MTEVPRQPKPVTVTVEGEDPRDVQLWLHYLKQAAMDWDRMKESSERATIAMLHPSSFVIQPKVK